VQQTTSTDESVAPTLAIVMAGLVPAIHVFGAKKDVDARHKAGHDEPVGR
jgi:hypothetical protein